MSDPSERGPRKFPAGIELDLAQALNAMQTGYTQAMGLAFEQATPDVVTARWSVRPDQLQVHGIVHGGVHAGVIETVCSVGAALAARDREQTVVGLENHTTFIRAVRSGTLKATATPLTRGRRTQVWEAKIEDEQERLVATGRVRLLCLEPGTELGGPSGRAGAATPKE
jgi:uncharacterized protein (TIGR00369 family)